MLGGVTGPWPALGVPVPSAAVCVVAASAGSAGDSRRGAATRLRGGFFRCPVTVMVGNVTSLLGAAAVRAAGGVCACVSEMGPARLKSISGIAARLSFFGMLRTTRPAKITGQILQGRV
jgi:hypothetical protein